MTFFSKNEDGDHFVIPPVDQLVSDTPAEQRGIGVGIDLGTTNSAVAILSEEGIPKIISIPNNGQTVPSVVSLTSLLDGTFEVLVGQDAIDRELSASAPLGDNHVQTTMSYRNVKRVMGMGGSTAAISAEVVPNLLVRTAKERRKGRSMGRNKSTIQPSLTQQLEEAEKSPARLLCPSIVSSSTSIDCENEDQERPSLSPEDISSKVLNFLFRIAEEYAGQRNSKVTRAVVGVPAYFNDAQRSATIRACELAGVPKVRLLREPEAAALAYGIGREQALAKQQEYTKKKIQSDAEELVLVFDLGGGTFDVSILTVCDGLMEVIATSGNNLLGGSDFDARIAQYMSKSISAASSEDRQQNFWKEGGMIADALIKSAESTRIYLSNNKEANLLLPKTKELWLQMENPSDIILQTPNPDMEIDVNHDTHVFCQLTRKKMEELCTDEFQALLRPVREVAIMAGALLPGDASPSAVEAVLQMEEDFDVIAQNSILEFDNFFDEDSGVAKEQDEEKLSEEMLLQLNIMDMKEKKRAQQKGRKRARNLRKDEKKFRAEKKKAAEQAHKQSSSPTSSRSGDKKNVKVRDGINGRRISQVVLVGGATRMPAIGRLLAAVTGIVPQRTVNPDEAVALGCAVQVGILDGNQNIDDNLQVLSPIEAAMIRALAKKRGLSIDDDFDDDFDDFDD